MRTLSSLEQRTLDRIQNRGQSLQAALDNMTAGPPVDGEVRPRVIADTLYRIKDPAFLNRMSSAEAYLTEAEKAAENRRSQRTGGYLVYPGKA